MKNIIRNTLNKLGYDIQKMSQYNVKSQNFTNLANAYEYFLNKENPIKKDDVRVRLMARLAGTLPSQAYFIVQALTKTKYVNGEVCEFGVAQGETSALIANEILSGNKILHLVDSFEGLPSPTEKDVLKDDIFSLGDIKKYEGTMACSEDMVLARLKSLNYPDKRLVLHKGFIEELIKKENRLPTVVSFAYVDFDFYEPIKIALEYLHKSTVSGSIIMVDDYDYFSTGAKTAVDEFIDEKNRDSKVYDCVTYSDPTYPGHFALITRI